MNKKELLEFEVIAIRGNTGYASAYDRNGLYKVNLNNEECQFITFFDESFAAERIHCAAIWIKSKVYFIPASGDKISVYNAEDSSLRTILIPKASREEHSFYSARFKFIDVVNKNNYLWLIPSTYPGLLRYDINSDEIDIFDSWIPGCGYRFRSKAVIEGNSILVPSGNNNVLLKFNMSSNTGTIYTIGDHNNGASCIKKIGAEYFLAPMMKGSIVAWNPSLNKAREFMGYPESFSSEQGVFSSIYSHGGRIYFTQMRAKHALFLQDDKLFEDEVSWNIKENDLVWFSFETNTHLYYQEHGPNTEKICYKISKSDRTVSETEFRIINPNREKEVFMEIAGRKRDILFDNGYFNLDFFLDSLCDV